MKRHFRSVATVVLVAILSVQFAPVAVAAPRDRDDFPAKIERILSKIKRFIGLTPSDDGITPPWPKP